MSSFLSSSTGRPATKCGMITTITSSSVVSSWQKTDLSWKKPSGPQSCPYWTLVTVYDWWEVHIINWRVHKSSGLCGRATTVKVRIRKLGELTRLYVEGHWQCRAVKLQAVNREQVTPLDTQQLALVTPNYGRAEQNLIKWTLTAEGFNLKLVFFLKDRQNILKLSCNQ